MDHLGINEKQRSLLMDYLNPKFRPYTNFHEYASSKWCENHKENIDNYTNVLDMLNYEANLEVMEYLQKTPRAKAPRFVKNRNLWPSNIWNNWRWRKI